SSPNNGGSVSSPNDRGSVSSPNNGGLVSSPNNCGLVSSPQNYMSLHNNNGSYTVLSFNNFDNYSLWVHMKKVFSVGAY
ncbi:8235_t:CDS:1, partial [Ambispora leptoticha]